MPRPIEVTFTAAHDYEALESARKWLRERGYSIGALQADAPTAVFKGDCDIAKWRNLSREERASADGQLTAPGRTYRSGPIHLILRRPLGWKEKP